MEKLERQEKELYNQRRAIGQIADQKAKYAKELPSFPEAPNQPVSAYELIQRQQDILARNGENQRKRANVKALEEQAAKTEDLLRELERKTAEAQDRYARILGDLEIAQKDALDIQDESTEELENSLREIEAINAKVRTNQDKAQAEAEAKECGDQYAGLTAQLEAVRKEKQDLLEGAKLPLPGLSVEDGELTYRGRPWDGMSGSDQLKVSTAIVRALKPECGFVLLDKLEQMDLETLAEFGRWAEQEGLQIIATRVSTGGECSIIIEDGLARAAEGVQAENPPVWQRGEF